MLWLTSQSVWVLVIGCLAVALAIGLGSRALALKFIPEHERDDAHGVRLRS